MIPVKIIKKPKGANTTTSGVHVSGSSSTTSRVGYAENAGNADYAAKAGTAGYAENAGLANYANEAGEAQDLAEGGEAYNKFLRKDIDDTAAGEITFEGGTVTNERADFGEFFSDWLLGTGARIDEEGNAEFKSLKVRESLDVAMLVLNKITAQDAEQIISPGRGVVKSVSQVTSTTGSITLKLQENEWATVAENDICRGIYNNIAASQPDNWTAGGTDSNGFRRKKGFFTSYFKITSIQSIAGSCTLGYELQPGTSEHPCENMVFASYGNFTNTNRQSSIYITAMGIAPRMMFLAGVDTWAIGAQNLKIAIGNINGLQVIEELADASEYNANTDPNKFTEVVDGVTHYYAHLTLQGDAGFFCEDNIYLGGIINQIKIAALDAITDELGTLGQSWVSPSDDSFVVDCDEDGDVDGLQQFSLSAYLFFGNDKLALDGSACEFRYGNITSIPTLSESGKKATVDYTFSDGSHLTSGNITISLTSTSTGGTTYTAMRTVSIIANRRGMNGTNGRGVDSIKTYYKRSTSFSGVTPPEEGVSPQVTGWSETRIDPTEAQPYLWRFTRITYTSNPTVEQSDAELISVWQDIVNPNLLDDTEFLSDDEMTAWTKKGYINSTAAGVQDNSELVKPKFGVTDKYDKGYKQFYGRFKALANGGANSNVGAICFLEQYLHTAAIDKVQPSTWYTLSFYVFGKKSTDGPQDQNGFLFECNLETLADTSFPIYYGEEGGETTEGHSQYINFNLADNSAHDFKRYIVTFKTPISFSGNVHVQWYMRVREYTQEIWFTKPKLEIGQVATDYRPKRIISDPVTRTSTWEAGKQYYQGKVGEPYLDIVAKYNRWYRCLVTHVSKNENQPDEGSSTLNWEKSNHLAFIATDLLLADQGVLNLLFSQKILMKDSENRLTASINADEHGSYCIYYPETGRKMFELSYSKNVICYRDDELNSTAWRIGSDGQITFPDYPRWNYIYMKSVSDANNSFRGSDRFTLIKFPQYYAGSDGTGIQSKNGKIYKVNHQLFVDGGTTMNVDDDYIADGWYTSDTMPSMVISDGDTDTLAIEIMHIVNGSITGRKTITTTLP